MSFILVVDDESGVRETLISLLERDGYKVTGAATVAEAQQRINEEVYDLVITDLKLGTLSGMDVLKAAKRAAPITEVIVLTGHGTVESAVEAMKLGATDYIMKPVTPDELTLRVETSLGRKRMAEEIGRLREQLQKERGFDTIIAESDGMKEVLHLVTKVADSDTPIMLQGESGTGKELLARALHSSGRPNGPFVPINCSALPETLLESELFGYMRGSFTGAVVNKKGLFEEADHGTLFMDEIGDMAAMTQVKLLRALDIGEIRRVGSSRPVYIDARLIAATNKNIESLVQDGSFREELYYRLNVISIVIPPLRERRADIPPLAEHFLKLYGSKMNKKIVNISPEARTFMARYDWPGNVRELENCIERAVVLSQHDTITSDDLPFSAQFKQSNILRQATQEKWNIKRLEKEHIMNVLTECSGNRSLAAERLGIGRNTLWRKLREYSVL